MVDHDVPAAVRSAHPDDTVARERPRSGARLEIIALLMAALLAVGVVVAALDMKFEADQARWQQRQTCLDWYRLQADYGVGPWFEKLPAAAVDCGGGENDDGDPTVPGGSAPALLESDLSVDGPAAPTSAVPAVPSPVVPAAPTSVAPSTP